MCKFISYVILLMSCAISHASDWMVVPSNDGYWLKTINTEKHELLIAYSDNNPL